MADLILHKRSSTAAAVPSAGSIALGELAINTTDARLFLKKGDGTVVDVTSIGGIQGLTAALDGKVGGGDARLTDAREWTADTVSQAEAEAGTGTNRRAWTAQRVFQAVAAWWNGVTTAWGRGFVASADAAAGRTALGLGNAATRTALGTTGALYSRDSILGAVSQSGGIPTGAIIERGSNANGEYVRYADGTQICHRRFTITAVADTDNTPSWSLPASMIDTSYIAMTTLHSAATTASFNQLKLQAAAVGVSSVNMRLKFSVSQDYQINNYAVGRWF